jgi:hypothetical protein
MPSLSFRYCEHEHESNGLCSFGLGRPMAIKPLFYAIAPFSVPLRYLELPLQANRARSHKTLGKEHGMQKRAYTVDGVPA